MKKILFIITVTFSVIFMFQVVFCNENTDEILKQKYDSLEKFTNDIVYGFSNYTLDSESAIPPRYRYWFGNIYQPIVKYNYGNGVLGGYIGDLDNDNENELIVFKINCGTEGIYCNREKTNAIDIDVYEVKNGEAFKADTIRGIEHIFSEGNGGVECFIKTVENKKYICIQNTDDYISYLSATMPFNFYVARLNINIFSYNEEKINLDLENNLYYDRNFYAESEKANIFYDNEYFTEYYNDGDIEGDYFYKEEDAEKFKELGFNAAYNYVNINNSYDLIFNHFNMAEMEDNVCKVYEMKIYNNILDVKSNKNCDSDYFIRNAKVTVKQNNFTNFNNKDDIKIYYKGEPLHFVYNQPKIVNDKIMLPVREFFSYLGCNIVYNGVTKELNLSLKNENSKKNIFDDKIKLYNELDREELKTYQIVLYNGFDKFKINNFIYDLKDGAEIIDNIYYISLNDIEDIMNVINKNYININNETIYIINK